VLAQTWEPGGGGPSVCCECIRTAAAAAVAAVVGRRGARARRGNMCQQLSPVIDLSRGRRRRARIYACSGIYIQFCDLYT